MTAAYAVAAMLVLIPLLNLFVDWPPRPDLVTWRFDQFRLLAGALAPAGLGLALALYVARAANHRALITVLAAATVIGAVALLLLLANFGLDAAQLRNQVAPGDTSRFTLTVLRVALQSGIVAMTLMIVGWAGMKVRRMERRRIHSDRERSPAVGSRVGREEEVPVES